jgi:FlaA1/EpsC-like NDP-sugar epimerase
MAPNFRSHTIITTAKAFDLIAVSVTFLTSFAISSGSLDWPHLENILAMRIKLANFLLLGVYLALCLPIFSICGLYRSHRLSRWKQRLAEIILATTLATALFLFLSQLFLIGFVMQVFLPVFWMLTVCVLWLSHELTRIVLQLARRWGRNLRNIVIIGEGRNAVLLANRIHHEVSLGYRVLRIIDAKESGEDDRVGVGDTR